jgi:hypothetical protein
MQGAIPDSHWIAEEREFVAGGGLLGMDSSPIVRPAVPILLTLAITPQSRK